MKFIFENSQTVDVKNQPKWEDRFSWPQHPYPTEHGCCAVCEQSIFWFSELGMWVGDPGLWTPKQKTIYIHWSNFSKAMENFNSCNISVSSHLIWGNQGSLV